VPPLRAHGPHKVAPQAYGLGRGGPDEFESFEQRTFQRILSLASDFTAIAKRLDGPRLRDHLCTWLARAEFDKNTRDLTLTIRRIPAVGAFLPSPLPGPVSL
jgi:hypothetical protein